MAEAGKIRYYEFGEFRLDSKRRILFKNGEKVPLSSRIYDLLLVLVQNEGQILGHDELLDKVWEGMFVEQSNLKKSVSALRQILGENANESLYIKTIPRHGYSFICSVRALPDDPVESVVVPPAATLYRETEQVIVVEEIIENDESEIIVLESPKALPNFAPAALPAAPPAPTGFLNNLKKYRIAVGVLAVLIIFATYFAAKSFRAKPTFNYSVENVRAKRLTNEGNLGNSAPISPDGNYIVYPVYFGTQGSLWLRQVQTGSVARLTPIMEAQYWAYEFSPDGNYVYYIINHTGESGESGLFRIPTLGGAPQKLLDRANGGLTFASDGSRFAFTRLTEDKLFSEVVSAKADGSDLKRAFVIPDNKTVWSLRWSPDGVNLLYSVRERGENRLYGYVAETRWDNTSEAAVENIVFPKEENQVVINANWLPDKTSLLLSLREQNADICQLWQYMPATGEKRRITNDDNSYRIMNLTRDGKSFSTVQENWKSEAWVAENGSLDFHPMSNVKNIGNVIWTKQNQLIYEAAENQQAAIWMTNEDGNGKWAITKGNDGIYLNSNLSLSGEYLTFVSVRSGSSQIWRINIDGSNPQQLTNSASQVSLRSKLLSDNKTLLFMARTNIAGWNLQKLTADGKVVPITQVDTDYWSLSPDEKTLAVIVRDEKTKKYKTQIQNLETGEVSKTFDLSVVRQLSWTRDGKAIAYITPKQDMDELVLQPLDGSPAKILSSTRNERISSFDWSFDGSKLIVIRSKFTSDAFIIRAQENF